MGNEGVISFLNYEVTKISYKINDKFSGDEVDIDAGVSSNIEVSEDNKKMIVYLNINVFENAEKNNYPFEMSVSLRGHFLNRTEESIEKYHANALAIMYPYARAIVSTYTASANIPPLILPTVNINKMLKKKQ